MEQTQIMHVSIWPEGSSSSQVIAPAASLEISEKSEHSSPWKISRASLAPVRQTEEDIRGETQLFYSYGDRISNASEMLLFREV